MKRQRGSILRGIVKHNRPLRYLICCHLLVFLIMTLLIQAFEPGMSQFGDAAWYCFVSCTTIGFGDFTAVSFLGRMVTVVLYLLTVVVIALITATITQYFLESMKAKHDGSMALFVDQLERLPELSHEELVEISEKVKKHNANKD